MTAAEAPDDGTGAPAVLPEPVRARVVALAADALGRLAADQLPAPLRRVAAFAPARRAKLAGTQIASVLETDEGFRSEVAVQVRAAVPEVAHALDAGSVPAAADPVELAAVAYLLRPDGWAEVVAEASARAGEGGGKVDRGAAEQVERLRRRLADAQAETAAVRERGRVQVEEVKAENHDLRRTLHQTRQRVKAAEEAAEAATGRAASDTEAAAVAVAGAEVEVRRLRARVAELERELGVVRRAERVERDTGTLRARLLLDTLLDAATGLRRELALPAVEGSPADSVAAHLAEAGERTPTGHGSLPLDDPTMLDQLLAMPRAHLVVDGYNVTKTTWPELPLDRQRDRLLSGIGPLAARSGAEVTVVFDAAETKERPVVTAPRGVRVLYSPYGVIADDVIRDLVAAEPPGRPVTVVTNDQAVVRDVRSARARVVACGALAKLLARGGR